ncbi:M20/M25/M40 family metallo-hydrolase [Taibaiella koreensis]|uniref:M20/M25/M40 family metallo-hydrolase n=1 Tax=Taibaiella koreensis TaxID=1268548 RepID=UPI000E59B99E|nr:M20/M25/M40 family metallo-hydrolase [Taibaiella koreensis]
MKKMMVLIPLLAAAMASFAQNPDSATLRRLSDDILWNGVCYDNLRVLTKTIGHRLSGSPAADKAVAWGKKAMEAAGADRVWLQPVDVPLWIRGKETLKVQLDGHLQPIPMLSLGNTEGTGGKTLEREIVCVPDLAAFEKLEEDQVRDKIIFFNYKFRQDIVNTFEGYGDAVKYRWVALNKAAGKHAAAVIIRSVSTGADDVPHTGASRYDDGVAHIPAVAIGNFSADKLAAACAKGQPKAQLVSNCSMKGTKRSYNVIGELKGATLPNEIIVVGGHLDSWDVGEGAHDDGAGCVQSIEVLRALKASGKRPRRTIRAVLFMNEENGAKGGVAYADSARTAGEKHILAMESDAGGFSPRGIGLEMPEPLKQKIRSWAPLLLPYGVYDFTQEEGGIDIGPLRKQGVPLAGLLPDSQRYFDLHHSRNDVFEAISHRELKLGACTMMAIVWLADQYL